jgi:hypothetical protein
MVFTRQPSSSVIIGGFSKSLRALMPGRLLAVILATGQVLLACDGCGGPSPTETVVEIISPPPLCRTLQIASFADSAGQGPVRAVVGPDGLALLHRGTSDQDEALYFSTFDLALQPIGQPLSIEPETAGRLIPEALAIDRNAVAAVGRQEGGRAAYLLSRLGDGAFTVVETPRLASLDRRVSVRLIEPRSGGGIQVATHISGETRVSVGRLAGGMLVTRDLELARLLAPPEAVSAPGGALALLTAERLPDGRRTISLREVDPDATPSRTTLIAELGPGEHVEQLALQARDERYVAHWLVSTPNGTSIERAFIDEETLEATRIASVSATQPGGRIIDFAEGLLNEWPAVVWVEANGGTTLLSVQFDDEDATPEETRRAVVATMERADIQGLQLLQLGERHLLLWRQVAAGEIVGDVRWSWFECTPP